MLNRNYLLTQITQRYTLPLSGERDYLYAHLHAAGLDAGFLAAIIDSFEENSFNAAEFAAFDIEMIVDYIQHTHVLYLQKTLPELEQSIFLLHDYYEEGHPLLRQLHGFFHDYYQDLTTHVREEEDKLLPYIALLRKAGHTQRSFSAFISSIGNYSVRKFLTGHHDTEDELAEIRRIIHQYTPPPTNQSLYRILLLQLQTFEQDLHVHAHMEEEVLIPKALELEEALIAGIEQAGKHN